jgi:hypothetical protein
MIFLQPHSGLANRLRVIVSALSFSEKVNQDLVIYWEKDSGLNCDFFELYSSNEKLDVRKPDIKVRILDKMKNKGIFKLLFNKLYKIDFSLFDNDFRRFVWNRGDDHIDMSLIPKNVRNYHIKVCNEFSFDASYLQYLKPAKNIQTLINEAIDQFPAKIIGVHIRRTDNDIAIEESPVYLFVERIKKDLVSDPEMHYFLATDDPTVEEELMKLFPSRIFSLKKNFTRDSKEGIIGAMLDLYCLAATTKIYGSYWSSFSALAARIGNIQLIVIKK